MTSVLVTRPEALSAGFAQQLVSAGFEVFIAPMLEYTAVEADLTDIAEYKLLVFTSSQAVKFFTNICVNKQFTVFAVGDATAEKAAACGFKRVYSAEGNSGDLAGLMINQLKDVADKKLLHLCSADTPDELRQVLAAAGLILDKKVIYKANPINIFPENVHKKLQNGEMDIVTLFSPRTANIFIKTLKNNSLTEIASGIKAVCLSENVALEAQELVWKEVIVAEQPNLQSVLKKLIN